ncbi:hypothetical protein FOXYSP1_08019 [Fusarium oxysporum f. sp. phaseoli]
MLCMPPKLGLFLDLSLCTSLSRPFSCDSVFISAESCAAALR